MKKILSLFLLVAIPLTAAIQNRYNDPAQAVQSTDIGALSQDELRSLILEAHRQANAFRAENGKAPLAILPDINHWSQIHSEWMAARRYGMSHEGFMERIDLLKEQIPKIHGGGENVAFIFGMIPDPVTRSMKGWIKSPGHRENLLRDFNLCGYGIARSKNGSWHLTHLFIKCADESYVSKVRNNEWNGGPKEEEPIAEEPVEEEPAPEEPAPEESAPEEPAPEEPAPEEPVKEEPAVEEPKEIPDINDEAVRRKLHDFPQHYFRYLVMEEFNKLRATVNRRDLFEHPIPHYYSQRHSDSMAVGKYPLGDTGIKGRLSMVKNYLPQIRNMAEWYAKIPIDHPNPSKAAADQWAADGKKRGIIYSHYNLFGCGISKSDDGHYYYSVMLLFSTHPALN